MLWSQLIVWDIPSCSKIESPDVMNKTEAGLIGVSVQDAQDLRNAGFYCSTARAVVPTPRINGLLSSR